VGQIAATLSPPTTSVAHAVNAKTTTRGLGRNFTSRQARSSADKAFSTVRHSSQPGRQLNNEPQVTARTEYSSGTP
jgi:hypothetical protein